MSIGEHRDAEVRKLIKRERRITLESIHGNKIARSGEFTIGREARSTV
jgi:hypothetical protein